MSPRRRLPITESSAASLRISAGGQLLRFSRDVADTSCADQAPRPRATNSTDGATGQSIAILAILSIGLITGCHRAQPPKAVIPEIAATMPRQGAPGRAAGTEEALDKTLADIDVADAGAAYSMVPASTEGDHSISLATCEALLGDDQTRCQDRANAHYEIARVTEKMRQIAPPVP